MKRAKNALSPQNRTNNEIKLSERKSPLLWAMCVGGRGNCNKYTASTMEFVLNTTTSTPDTSRSGSVMHFGDYRFCTLFTAKALTVFVKGG